ncbi:hypothetical protein C5B93_07715 [Rathayibacter sp. AY1A2]|nr:hypothetical protein C5B93_07715 [Rathayibacter sp. AY1A2]PPG72721.1 hypothetical protein C5C59_06070 [Rathayibacter sp. AY1F4]PPH54747.1 hypothetical protein C5C49_01200 [Rathayibacter sp. AY1E2]
MLRGSVPMVPMTVSVSVMVVSSLLLPRHGCDGHGARAEGAGTARAPQGQCRDEGPASEVEAGPSGERTSGSSPVEERYDAVMYLE